MPEATTPIGRMLRWPCTAACSAVSFALVTWLSVRGPFTSPPLVEGLGRIARGAPELMVFFLPLWLPELAFALAPSGPRWLRLICGAIGIANGIAMTLLSGFWSDTTTLVVMTLTYFTLGFYNCWLALRWQRVKL